MAVPTRRDWLSDTRRHQRTDACERGLRAAAGIVWQHLGRIASGGGANAGEDFFDPARTVVAEYLRHTGRMEEAIQVEALGCNEKPPAIGFSRLSAVQIDELRQAMQG